MHLLGDVDRILRAMAKLQAVAEIPVRMSGMHKGEFAALNTLMEVAKAKKSGEVPGLAISELSRELGISAAGVSQMANQLAAKGYVKRVQDDRDRRVVRLLLTERGVRTGTQVQEQLRTLTERILCRMGEEDARIFVELADRASSIVADELECMRECATQHGPGNLGRECQCGNSSGI